jgi:capsular polysaccharide biosynthesis protein
LKLKEFLASIRRHWKTFVVVAGVVFALGLAWIILAPTKFVSTTQLMVSIAGSTTAAAYQNDEVVAGRVNSYIALLTSDVVNQRVIDRLGLSLTAPELAAKVSATNVPPKTAVIDVAVTAESPAQARLLANTLAAEFINYAKALETPTGEDGQKVNTTVVTAASEPRGQSFERILLGALAAVTALVLGAVAVWIRSRTDPVVRTADRAAAAAGVPVIGCGTSAPAAAGDDFDGYRRLRTRLRSMASRTGQADDRGHVWVFTSAVGEVDTAVVASNLGRAMELAGSRSIVLDAGIPQAEVASDATQPAADHTREADNETVSFDGPADALAQPSIRRGAGGFPDTLSASTWARDPDLAATKAAAGLFDQLRNEYAHVMVAAPPVLTTITASVVSESADGVLLVISLGTTRRRDLAHAADNLRATGAPLTGAVLSEMKPEPDIVCSENDRKRSDTVNNGARANFGSVRWKHWKPGGWPPRRQVSLPHPAKPSDHSMTKER